MTDPNSRPPIPPPPPSLHSHRRSSGPRQADSEQICLRNDTGEICGWTLNQSRGGARLIVEEPVAVGQNWDMVDAETKRVHPVRIVWVRDEAGGQIVGVQFLDAVGTIPPFDGPSSDTK